MFLQAMLIQNRVKANEVTDDKSRIKQMEREISELKRKLASQAGSAKSSPARERWKLAKMVRDRMDPCMLLQWTAVVNITFWVCSP